VDVSRDAAGAEQMVRQSGQRGVPVTVVDGQVVVGYDRPRLEQLLGASARPRLGAAVADAAEMARRGRTNMNAGAYVGRVSPGSAAKRAGLRPGDVIVSIADHGVATAADVERIVPRIPRGRDVPVVYVREGSRHRATLRYEP